MYYKGTTQLSNNGGGGSAPKNASASIIDWSSWYTNPWLLGGVGAALLVLLIVGYMMMKPKKVSSIY